MARAGFGPADDDGKRDFTRTTRPRSAGRRPVAETSEPAKIKRSVYPPTSGALQRSRIALVSLVSRPIRSDSRLKSLKTVVGYYQFYYQLSTRRRSDANESV